MNDVSSAPELGSQEFFNRNLSALQPHLRSSLIERLATEPPLNVAPVLMENGTLNMTVEGQAVYVPDARTYSEEQVTAYIKSPTQLSYTLDSLKAYEAVGVGGEEEISVSIIKKIRETVPEDLSPQPRPDTLAGHCVSMGLGLGFHLQPLYQALSCRDLIIFDPCLDTFRSSLRVMDWRALVEMVEGRGGRIKFIFELDNELAAQAIMAFLREENFALIEGSYIISHYPLPDINRTLAVLAPLMRDLIIYNGWLEDEMIHFSNGMRNFQYRDLHLISEPLREIGDTPAFIVGSGPSLDRDIETIKQLAGKAVIFSCGSSIRILLSHGIRPDFHCELENVFTTVPVIAEVAGKFDLSGITLVASATVHPAVMSFFDKHITFFREGGGTVRWLQQDNLQFSHASPSCTNVGCRLAIQMGFSSLYLFGLDMGSISRESHHASGSIYTSLEETDVSDRVDEMKLAVEAYPLETEANFGGVAYTSPLMLFMKNGVELLARAMPDVRIHNCSNGARIKGCEPLRSMDIVLPADADGRGAAAAVMEQLPVHRRGEYVKLEYIRRLEASLELWNDRLKWICEDPSLDSFLALHDRMRKLCDSTLPIDRQVNQFDRATRIIMSGTMLKVMHFIRFVDCRLAESERVSFLARVKMLLKESLPGIAERQLCIVRNFRRRVQRGSACEVGDFDLLDDSLLTGICQELGYTGDRRALGSFWRLALESDRSGILAGPFESAFRHNDQLDLYRVEAEKALAANPGNGLAAAALARR